MDFSNLSLEDIETIKKSINFKEQYTIKQRGYFDKYIKSEKGKIKRREINKRYYNKIKLNKKKKVQMILENQHEVIVESLEV